MHEASFYFTTTVKAEAEVTSCFAVRKLNSKVRVRRSTEDAVDQVDGLIHFSPSSVTGWALGHINWEVVVGLVPVGGGPNLLDEGGSTSFLINLNRSPSVLWHSDTLSSNSPPFF